ncbi:MAG: UvrD-helicase domain-containing protein [Thermoleophilia bacterium]|nr:UvrD-helicase domain-containing protein [Thermoleophilia bacterium]
MADELTAEQKRAIESRAKHILLEAGAGTGKTRTTVDRYAALLKEEVPASRIMVFTFTEKAANELRERVRAEVPGKDGGAFSMSHAWIGTFHSICASILRAHPMEADIDPTFTILDDIQSSLLKSDSYDRALSRFINSDERLKLISGFYPPNLQKGVSNAFEQLRSRGQISPKLPVPKGNDLGEAIDALTLECARTKALGGPNATTIAQIERLEEYLQKTPDDKVTFRGFGEEAIASGSDYLKKVRASMKRCQAVLAEREFGEENRVALAELLEAYSETYSKAKRAANVLDYEDLQLKTLALLTDEEHPAIGERYRAQFDEIMVDEFQDTNQLQIDLIESLCGEETRFFTVGDEMQAIYGFRHADIRLFRKRRLQEGLHKLGLTANFRSEPAIIGAVNRIGQSLDDELGELRDAEKPGDDDRPGGDEEENLDRHEFKSLRAGREDSSGDDVQVEILFTQKEGWTELNLGPLWPGADPGTPGVTSTSGGPEAEALLLAHHIKSTLAETGIKPSETAILFKAKARMSLFAEALTQVGLRPYIIGGSGFWESREGVDLRSLLAVVANPLDDESLIAALAGPACGLSTDAMFLLRRSSRKDPLWQALSRFASGEPEGNPSAALAGSLPEDHKLAAAFVDAINSVRKRASSLPLGELVEATVTATGFDLVNLIRDPEAIGLANMKRIASLASRYESNEGRDLRGFLEWADLSARLDAEDAVATQEEESDVVRLMTIHKAKGLEFELVCVADLGRGKNNSGETVFWIGPDPESEDDDEDEGDLLFGMKLPQPDGSSLDLFDWTKLSDAAKRERTEEEMRLFHVALTRAKRRLVMSAVVDLDDPEMDDGTSIATNLASVLKINDNTPESVDVPAPELLSGAAGVETRIPVRRNLADEDQEAHLSRTFDAAPAVEIESDDQPPLWRPETPAFPNVPLSFTALSEFLECPACFYAKRVLRLKEPAELTPEVPELGLSSTTSPEEQSLDARDDGTKFGSAIHELFEASAERRWVRPTDGEIEKRLNQLGVDLADGESFERAKDMIHGFFDSDLGKRVQAARCEIEMPLLVRAGQVTIRGFADLLIPDSDPPLVLDYKTSRLGGKAPAEKMADYELQRDLYALAVQRASGAETVETAFVFLERPDEPVLNVLNRSDLELGQKKLLAVVREIELGHFFGGPDAERQPCGDCWACERLDVQIERARETVATA